jgi:hypothetical protein
MRDPENRGARFDCVSTFLASHEEKDKEEIDDATQPMPEDSQKGSGGSLFPFEIMELLI